MIKVNENQQRSDLSCAINGPDPSRVKVWVIQQRKEPQSAVVLAEGKENIKWVLEDCYKDQL